MRDQKSQSVNPYQILSTADQAGADAFRENPKQKRSAYGGALGIASLLSAIIFACWSITLSSGASFFVLLVTGLVIAPYLVLWIASRDLVTLVARLLIAITLMGCLWLGVTGWREVSQDAQGALNLVFVPIFQLGGTLATMCLAVSIEWLTRKVFSAPAFP